MRRLFAAAMVTAMAATGIQAAEAQNYRLNPTFGSVNLVNGFTPDPYSTSLQAGGNISASNLGSNCRGFIADAPDYRVNYQAGGNWPLNIYAQSGSDTTLVVNDPSGRWFCDDDGLGNLNPLVTFNGPQSGQYDIWVGTYSSSGSFPQATLSISELDPRGGGSAGGGGGGGGGSPDYSLQPTYGTVNLNNGFTPDPYSVSLTAGGNLDAGNLGANCRGYVAQAPDYRLYYQAGGGWPLNIFAQSGSDTTLVVNDPNGRWNCDDDGYGNLNPLVTFNNPASGQYDIWVGTYSSGGFPQATLSISELNQAGGSGGGGGGGGGGSAGIPDYNLQPSYGTVNLTNGFTPDPYAVSLNAGGNINASNLGGNCRGSVAQAPDYRVYYQAGGNWPLYIYALSGTDTTLVVNGPNGQWFCDDDGGNGVNPSLTFNRPQSGQYDIWVGTYSSSGGFPPASLYISEVRSTQ